jgi:hypothetical protein
MALVPLTSCTNIAHRHVTNDLYLGATAKEVVLVMGDGPAEKKSFGGKEVMVYYVYSSIFDLIVNWEKFPYVGFYPLLSTGQEFWIILNDNRVESFGYAKNFSNSLKNLK